MAPSGRNAKTSKFEQEQIEKTLINMIIINELPFSVVEHEGFKVRMEATFPGFRIPFRDMIYGNFFQLFLVGKSKVKSFIKRTNPRVCLSLDFWKSNQSVNYLRITAHFIDNNWTLHKKVIGFTPIRSNEGEEIGKVVENCLNDWEIDNVLTISTCEGSSNDAAVSYLRGRLTNSVLDGKYLNLKCFVDFTKSMVKQVFNDYDKSISLVRAAVRNVLQSPARIEHFKKRARELGIVSKSFLSLDSPSRWNSTFTMLKTAEKFEIIMDLFENKYDTCIQKMQKAFGIVTLLKGFYCSTEKIFGSYVTSNLFLEELVNTDFNLSDWGKSCCHSRKRSLNALEMNWKFSEYWGNVENSNMLIYVANILDPRRKMNFVEFYVMNNIVFKHEYTDEGVPLWKKKSEFVISAIYDLFNEYASKMESPQQNAKFQDCGYMHYLYKDTSKGGLGQRRSVGFGGNVECKTEIDIYLNEDNCQDFDGFDILRWWKFNSARFPILSKMAKDVLAIPVSTVQPESAFSTNGSLLDDFRSSLSPSDVEGLVCAQDWLRKSRKLIKEEEGLPNLDNFIKGMFEQLEDATNG